MRPNTQKLVSVFIITNPLTPIAYVCAQNFDNV